MKKLTKFFIVFREKINVFGVVCGIKMAILYIFFRDKYHDEILKRLDTIFKTEKLDVNIESQKVESFKVWFCWWDGYEQMPLIVRKCYESVLKNSIYEVIFIDKNNYSNYIKLDSIILENLMLGNITKTSLSDILRVKLLAQYGGLWLDATIFVTQEIRYSNDLKLITGHRRESNKVFCSQGRWMIFIMGSSYKNEKIFLMLEKMYKIYFSKYNYILDYWLIDYFIAYLYNRYPEIKAVINDNEFNNENTGWLSSNYNKKIDDVILSEWDNIKNSTQYHKLSWKVGFDLNDDKKFGTYVLKNE